LYIYQRMKPSSLLKSILAGSLLFILITNTVIGFSQTFVFQEDFADTAKNWTIIDNGTDGVTWKWLKSPTQTWSFYMLGPAPRFTTYSNGYMTYDSDSAGGTGNSDQNTDLISPSFNCLLLTKVLLSFEQQTVKYLTDTCKVSVSTDLVSWTDTIINQDMAANDTSVNPQTIIWDISSVAAGQPTVYIKFQWKGVWEYWWAIDDIKVYEPCVLGSTNIITDAKCKGSSDGVIDLTTVGSNPPFSFKWSTKDTTEDISDLIAGTYTVTITDSTGSCQYINNYIVNEPAQFGVVMSATNVSCQGGTDGLASASTYGGTTPYSFNWTGNRTEDVLKDVPAGSYIVTVTDGNGCTVNDSLVIIEDQKDFVDAGNDTNKCVEQSILVGASGGFVSYTWFDGSTTQSVQIDSAGIFVVTAIDSTGCSSNDSLMVSNLGVTPPDLGYDTSICINGQLQLDAGSGYNSYLWAGGETTQGILIDSLGIYSIIVTDVNGCMSNDSILISIITLPDPGISSDTIICYGDSIQFSSDLGFVNYVWSTGESTNTIVVDTIGIYYVTVTDSNSCQNSDSVELGFRPFASVSIGNDTIICQEDSALIMADSSFISYLWGTGETTQSVFGYSGQHHVIVRDTNSCFGFDTMTITNFAKSVFDIGNDTIICQEDSMLIVADVGLISYLWGNGETTQSMIGYFGQYHVVVRDTNTCLGYDSMAIANFAKPVFDIGNDTSFCIGDTLKIDAGAGYKSYVWSTGMTTQSIAVDLADIYSVEIEDVKTCNNTDTIKITLYDLPIVNLGATVIMCELKSFDIDAGDGYVSYIWSTGETTQVITVKEPNNYKVTVIDKNGCDASGSKQMVFNPAPESALDDVDTLSCPGDELLLDAGDGFLYHLWNDGYNEQTRTISYPDTGLYTVIMFDINNCSAQDSIYIKGFVSEDRRDTCYPGVHVPFGNFVTIYPNPPTQGQVIIAFDDIDQEVISIKIFDYSGKVVLIDELKDYTGDYEKQIDLRNLPEGLYLMQIFIDNSYVVRKIINP